MIQGSDSTDKRPPKAPPWVELSLPYVRKELARLSLEDVGDALEQILGRRYGKGSLSAIESGKRGASPAVLEALEQVLELPVGSIHTEYTPREARGVRTDS